jgi:hypothetical protein
VDHPVSYPVAKGITFSGGKAHRSEKFTTIIHLEPRLRMCGKYLHVPYAFMAWYLFTSWENNTVVFNQLHFSK